MRTIAAAIGIGRVGDSPDPIRPHQRHIFRSARLRPWGRERMKFGWVLSWGGPYWHNAVGIAGPEWNDGNWLGGMVWHRHGPFVVARHRRRGSLRSDRAFARIMECECPRTGLLWPIRPGHRRDCPAHMDH